MTYKPSDKYFDSLESLRGLAALIVVFHNMSWNSPFRELGIVKNGYLMVDFFFVLSGFVIFHSYGHKLSSIPNFAKFVWLRIGRLFPLHFVLLLAFLGFESVRYFAQEYYGYTSDVPAFSRNNEYALVLNLLFLQAMGLLGFLTFNNPSWSVSTEFYTYILFALIVMFANSNRLVIGLISLAIILVCPVLIISIFGEDSLNFSVNYGYFRCVFGFFTGVITYLLIDKMYFRKSKPRFSPDPLISVIVILIVIAYMSYKSIGYSDFIAPFLSAILIWAIVACRSPLANKFLNLNSISWLGRVSYSVYMIHYAVVWWASILLKAFFNDPGTRSNIVHEVSLTEGLVVSIIVIAVVLVLSHYSFKYIENPYRLKSRNLIKNHS